MPPACPTEECDTEDMNEPTNQPNMVKFEGPSRVPRRAVLISGTGRTLANLIDSIERGALLAEIAVVISSKPGVKGLEVARAAGIPARVVERKSFESEKEFNDALFSAIGKYDPDLIVLAGFLRRIRVDDRWAGRILNIHPALLPEMAAASGRGFYGDRVHAEVLRLGATQSGASVHIVDNDYDSGPVIARAVVDVRPDDTPETLAARVFAAECELYPDAIGEYCARHWDWLVERRKASKTEPEM